MLTLRSTRSRFCFAAAALVGASAAAAASDDPSEVRRAAALLDYVQRDYGVSVVDGKVVNAAEYDEQQAFALDAADALSRLSAGTPFVAEVRAVSELIAHKAPAAEVSPRARSIHDRLLRSAGLSTSPPTDLRPAPVLVEESCAACHGADGRGNGFAAAQLTTRPTDFTGPERAQLTPYRVFSAVTWGVPHTSMPAYETSVGERRRWQIALTTLMFGHTEEDARRGEALAREKELRASELVPLSDEELRQRLAAFAPDQARALLAWVRRIASFAGPPPAGFPDLRTSVALAGIAYVHGGAKAAASRLREAQLVVWRPLEPLASPEHVRGVHEAFAMAREMVAAGEAKPRVLFAVAQLQLQIALAGPEQVPDAAALRSAGARAALRGGGPAALALAAAVAFAFAAERRRLSMLAAALAVLGAAAGAAIAVRAGWTWPWGIGAQLCSVAALAVAIAALLRRRASIGAALAAGLAALVAGADAASTSTAAKAVFAGLPSDLPHTAALAGAGLFIAALIAGGVLSLRSEWRRSGALGMLIAATIALSGSALQQAWLARP